MELRKFIIALGIALFIWPVQGHSQSPITVSTPEMTLNENNLEIKFDILNTSPKQQFNVKIEITDSEGKKIEANSFSGDIGKGIAGGSDKVVNWNLTADKISMDTDLFFQVLAEIAESNSKAELTRKNIVLQSLLMPGLGLSKQYPGKPHWLRGAAGYSCLAGSLGSYTLSRINDNKQDLGQEYYDKSIQQWRLSQGLLYAGIGFWVTDLVWNIAATKKLYNETSLYPSKGISIQSSYHSESKSPLLGFTYTF